MATRHAPSARGGTGRDGVPLERHRENGARSVALLPRVLCSGSAGRGSLRALLCRDSPGAGVPLLLGTSPLSATVSAGDFSAQDSFRAGSADTAPQSPVLRYPKRAPQVVDRPTVVLVTAPGWPPGWPFCSLEGHMCPKHPGFGSPEASPRRRAGARTQVPQRRFSVSRSDRPLVLGGMLTWAPRLSQFAVVQGPTRCVPCLQRKHPLWSPPAHLPQCAPCVYLRLARSLLCLKHLGFLTVGVT